MEKNGAPGSYEEEHNKHFKDAGFGTKAIHYG